MAERNEPAEPQERVVIEHERPLSAQLSSLTNEERAFRRWMDERASEDEPEADSVDDETEPGTE